MRQLTAYPSPVLVTTHAIHLANASSDQAAKASCQSSRREEEREPLLSFTPLVPHPDEIKATWELLGCQQLHYGCTLICLPCQLLQRFVSIILSKNLRDWGLKLLKQ
jgi:hypothetical protein